VSLEQRPLRLLGLQQVGAHRHLAARDVGAEALAHTPEREVATLLRRNDNTNNNNIIIIINNNDHATCGELRLFYNSYTESMSVNFLTPSPCTYRGEWSEVELIIEVHLKKQKDREKDGIDQLRRPELQSANQRSSPHRSARIQPHTVDYIKQVPSQELDDRSFKIKRNSVTYLLLNDS